jgi:UDPglucose 6-dehydrogenase
MAKLGHRVVGIDVDANKIGELKAGRAPFFEPGLPELLLEAQETGDLTFSTDFQDASDADVHFICVGTPQMLGENSADLTYVNAAFLSISSLAKPGAILVGKSTVPVGTAARLHGEIRAARPDLTVVWNPEFLREGHAVDDTLHPDRLVYGLENEDPEAPAVAILDEVYASALAEETPRLVLNFPTAELVKTAANSFLATKISFINAMAELCEIAGADVTSLADAIGLDDRIGRKFLNAGIGFGGGCLPKDIRAFTARAEELGAHQTLAFLREIDLINMRRRERAAQVMRSMLGGSLLGKTVAVLGTSFKPYSDDVRDSPALNIAQQLQLFGATVRVTDPQAIENSRRRFPELTYVATVSEAVKEADLVAVLTEWTEYRELLPEDLQSLMRGKAVFDGRNVLNRQAFRDAGWHYQGVGRA